MTPEEIKQLVRQEIQSANSALRFQLTGIPRHVHNGVDSPNVNQQDIVPNTRASGNITFAQSTQYRLGITFNPTSVLFYGNATRRNRVFTVTAANATVGDTYTNNGATFTVLATITGTTTLTTVSSGTPAASGTLTKATGSGDATITFSSSTNNIAVRAQCVGNAQLGASYYFQPLSTTSVQPSKTIGNLIQSASMMMIDSTISTPVVRVISDEENLIDVEYTVDYGTSISGIVARATIVSFSINSIIINVVLADGWSIVGNYVVT